MVPPAAGPSGASAAPRIYLVAADWQSRALTLAELQERGHEVLALPGLRFAEKALAAGRIPPRALVIDVHGDPEATPARVRALRERAPNVPAVLLVGAYDRGDYETLAPAFDAVLCRPVAVGDLVARVETLLERPERGRPAEPNGHPRPPVPGR